MERKRSENMKEIREAAVAYCKNMPENVNEEARSLFESMDTDNDKKISFTEFSKAYERLNVSGDQRLDDKLFKELDVNGDQHLNFEEFVTLFYIVQSGRLMYCDGCQHFLNGLYFTCLPCFDQGQTIVNYCTACYHDGRHLKHQHNDDVDVTFVDNYALLLSKAGSSNGAAEPTQELSYGAVVATLAGSSNGAAEPTTQELSYGAVVTTLSGPSAPGQPHKARNMKKKFGNFVGAIGIRAVGKAAGQATGKVTEAAGKVTGKVTEAVDDIATNNCSIM